VETIIPYQGNVVSFAAHVRNTTQYLAREKLRNWLYTKYEALMMTLETLQARSRSQMKHKAGLLFEVVQNKMNDIPFKLAMSNLAMTLTSWAKDLNINVPHHDDFRGDTVVVHTTARTIESSIEHTVWFVLQYVIHRPSCSVLPFFSLFTNRRSKRALTG
jgi:hypothetical protein